MKKIMNDPNEIVDEMIEGMIVAHSQLIQRVPETGIIQRRAEKTGKVGIVSGGGSGHEPAHAGFVGEGMLSAAVCGAVFTSPTPDQILEAIKVADEGAGVFLIIKNYSGDIMNFEMAQELAEMEDIEVESIVVDDDVAVEDSIFTQGKRGVAGTIFVHKILGYAAQQGKSIKEIKKLAEELVPNIKSIGLALTGVTTPGASQASFTLGENEIEYGVGIHGEPGYRREKLQPSYDLAEELLTKLAEEFDVTRRFAVIINGLGGTPLMEQYVFTNDVKKLMDKDEWSIDFYKVGNFMTSLEMQGLSLTLLCLEDDFYMEALSAPVETISW
ncbi:MAG: dihydroxyacetone kinase subunit DhaK [Alkalibacterium gilvum]|uniref:Dihydroxyacetone kinase, N-terminal domain n=1 Tax=Alkalibacterium gilvum TaxID=1130080 RepID=A0A1H6T5I5_9LACT|nr:MULTISPECIES: dihydroxyacetone kinase subunit DhaK [Alkalibacterium]MDN6194305.1 dihydroxyacetone kinase subunit DhaK [Alkalibacterium sp.]MDN6293948.1 dihydroxyacetone kinase subunit DhaK [Alkalibacterium sp.]MDN6296019.1 dihydroxyacetone kinase subunit DhaK [Alkalibacterium sp.]MDN6385433.1 dihydroxyacetone kinase subunit DhaK [Alkalibacterium sp.]MDN6398477.1 dihydroxyacetone kinase subunit DhaK [Alkalibacterium sp.]